MNNGFSEKSDSEKSVAPCDPEIIPIFPVRFALRKATLLNMRTSVATTPPPPGNIDDLGSHELVRIRQGWVYVYDGDDMQVFKFTTYADDENCGLYREDVSATIGSPYIFTKYDWPDGGPDGKWKPTGERYPFLFVPKDTPEAWVAYTETRWPYRFFYEAEKKPSFREKIMTKVDLKARSGRFTAPITELEKRVPAFRKDSANYPQKDYAVENAIRHTSVEIESANKILNCKSTKENGVIVALHDPIGEIQDLLGLISVHSMTLGNYLAEHAYPLLIGQAVENINKENEIPTSSFFFWDGALSKEFATEYQRLRDVGSGLERSMGALATNWDRLLARSGPGTIKAVEAACEEIKNRFSLKSHPRDHSETIAYWLFCYARMTTTLASCGAMTAYLNDMYGLTGSIAFQASTMNKTWLNKAVSATQGVTIAMKAGKKVHEIFKPALNAVFTVYGTQIAAASVANPDGVAGRLTALFLTKSLNFHKADELRTAFTTMLRSEGYGGAGLPDMVEELGVKYTATTRLTQELDKAERIGLVEFHAQIDMNFPAEYRAFARRAENFDFAGGGLGIIGATMSVLASVEAWNGPDRNVSAIGSFAADPKSQITAAFAQAYESTYTIAKTYAGRANGAATRVVLKEVFGGNAMLRTAAASNAALETRSIATKVLQGSARAAGVVGVAISVAMAYEGWRRGDPRMMVGNGLMALAGGMVAGLALLGPVGWGVAAVAVAAIAIGFVIALFSYSDHELWVKDGFWGTSDEYWNIDPRDKLAMRIADAKVLANPDSKTAKYNSIKSFFEKELEHYLDLNSELRLADARPNDGRIEIYCDTLQNQSDMSRLSVSVELLQRHPGLPAKPISGASLEFSRPGVAIARIPNGNYDPRFQWVVIIVRLQRVPHGGEFRKALSVHRDKLW